MGDNDSDAYNELPSIFDSDEHYEEMGEKIKEQNPVSETEAKPKKKRARTRKRDRRAKAKVPETEEISEPEEVHDTEQSEEQPIEAPRDETEVMEVPET